MWGEHENNETEVHDKGTLTFGMWTPPNTHSNGQNTNRHTQLPTPTTHRHTDKALEVLFDKNKI